MPRDPYTGRRVIGPPPMLTASIKEVPMPLILPVGLTIEAILGAAAADENTGFCLACGEEAYNVEPDARSYECAACGAWRVFGAEEIVIMLSD